MGQELEGLRRRVLAVLQRVLIHEHALAELVLAILLEDGIDLASRGGDGLEAINVLEGQLAWHVLQGAFVLVSLRVAHCRLVLTIGCLALSTDTKIDKVIHCSLALVQVISSTELCWERVLRS